MVLAMLPLLSVGVHLTGMNCYDGKHTYDPAIHAGKPICVSRATAGGEAVGNQAAGAAAMHSGEGSRQWAA